MIETPPYKVPLMAEVRNREGCNGFKVASTFAGGGGSSLGYRMAGFETVWANEFDAHAADTYEANSKVKVNRADIRSLTADAVLSELGMAPGELDALDGSPPCQTFSTAGKRRMSDPRSDLFFEYVRLVKGLQPKVFVAENVSGMVKGVAKGLFKMVLRELKACGYLVKCRILDAQWLGVPQQRQRAIFVGVREDLGLEPAFPKPLPYRYSVADACPWIRKVKQDPKGQFGIQEYDSSKPCFSIKKGSASHVEVEADITGTCLEKEWDKLKQGQGSDKYLNMVRADATKPCPTVTKIGASSRGTACVTHPTERRKFSIAELRRICSFPDDFEMGGSYAKQWAILGNSVPPLMMRAIAKTVRHKILTRI